MILFNIACIFIFRHNDERTEKYKEQLGKKIKEELENDEVSAEHLRYLSKKLRRINNLICFDKTLEELYPADPERIRRYIDSLTPTFIYLNLIYARKNQTQLAYFPYLISKYKFHRGESIGIIIDTMLELVKSPSLYCRENALHALYVQGDCESVITALKIIDSNRFYFHSKLITDGLQEFEGDRDRLDGELWAQLSDFSEKMQLSLLNYFRFSRGCHKENFFRLLTGEDVSDEIAYCAIRYFGKYRYEPAYPHLTRFAKMSSETHWEYVAISATALCTYPCGETVEILKELLKSRNWYVRYNASQSLLELGVEYSALAEILEGDDRYAAEILRYRFDQKRMKEKEAAVL